jgi:hypothetical protein
VKLDKSDWYLILLLIIVISMIGINELGYGVFSLFLLYSAYWLMIKLFEQEKPGN